MKKVLFVIDTLRMGGAEKSLVSLLKALYPNRISVDLYVFESGGVLQAEVPDWVNIIEADVVTRGMTLEMRKYIRNVIKSGHLRAAMARLGITLKSRLSHKPNFSWKSIKKHIPALKGEYDVAIGYLEGFPDFFVLDKVKADKKIGWIHIDFTGRKLPIEAIDYYNRFDELVTISDVCKTAFINTVPESKEKISIIENIVLTEEVRQKADSKLNNEWNKDKKYHFVSVGRLDYQKGMDVAAKVAKILNERKLSFCWHIYGKGIMQEEIEQYIHENNLQEVFILEGLTKNPYPYMKQADIIIQPSRWEGKSIVLDEAKILGKAIVVTNYTSVTDQITDKVTGIITGMKPEEIANGIELVLNDNELKSQLEKNTWNEKNSSYKAIDEFYKLIDA